MDIDIELFLGNTIDAERRAIAASPICGKCYKIVKCGSGKGGVKRPVVSKYFSLRTNWK
jgi:hypothetical protein